MSASPSPFKEIRFRAKTKKYFSVDLGSPRFSEIDMYQVMWNGNYVTYFEEARMALLAHSNVSLASIAEAGYYFPIYKMSFRMRKPVLIGERIEGATNIEIVDGTIRFHQLLRVGEETRATAEVDHMLVRAATMEAVLTPPQDLKDLFWPVVSEFEANPEERFSL